MTASSIPYPVRRMIIEFANKETARLVWESNCKVNAEVENIIRSALIMGAVNMYSKMTQP